MLFRVPKKRFFSSCSYFVPTLSPEAPKVPPMWSMGAIFGPIGARMMPWIPPKATQLRPNVIHGRHFRDPRSLFFTIRLHFSEFGLKKVTQVRKNTKTYFHFCIDFARNLMIFLATLFALLVHSFLMGMILLSERKGGTSAWFPPILAGWTSPPPMAVGLSFPWAPFFNVFFV